MYCTCIKPTNGRQSLIVDVAIVLLRSCSGLRVGLRIHSATVNPFHRYIFSI